MCSLLSLCCLSGVDGSSGERIHAHQKKRTADGLSVHPRRVAFLDGSTSLSEYKKILELFSVISKRFSPPVVPLSISTTLTALFALVWVFVSKYLGAWFAYLVVNGAHEYPFSYLQESVRGERIPVSDVASGQQFDHGVGFGDRRVPDGGVVNGGASVRRMNEDAGRIASAERYVERRRKTHQRVL